MILAITIDKQCSGQRLDDALAAMAGISKGEARRIIDRGGCAVNLAMVRVASRTVKSGDQLTVGLMQPGEYNDLNLPKDALLYEDDDLFAVNKPSGVPSQRTPYQLKGTLEFWVMEQLRLRGSGEPARVVHRLDRGTSGVMVFPKHRQAAAWLSAQFKDGLVEKTYLALVSGTPRLESWVENGPIGKVGKSRYGVMQEGKPASTSFRVIAADASHALVEAYPKTGRTHQIRVHLAAARLPIVGDITYGGERGGRLMLHCRRLVLAGRNGAILDLQAKPEAGFLELLGEG